MSDIFLKNISHSYDKKENSVLKNVNLTIKKGEFFTLLGPCGCGKTTLLRILAGFIQPTEGQVCIGEQDITVLQPEKRNMGIVFQNYALFPNMTVRDNIAYGVKIRKYPKQKIKEKCDYYMELSGLKEFEHRRIQELSGGQQQRVAIARALVIEYAAFGRANVQSGCGSACENAGRNSSNSEKDWYHDIVHHT